MVQLSMARICGILVLFSQTSVALVPLAAQATITPFPRSPWAPDSPYYGLAIRDDNKPPVSQQTADFKGGFCGFVMGGKPLAQCPKNQQCQVDKDNNAFGCGTTDSDIKTACFGDGDNLPDNVDTSDPRVLMCTAGNNNNNRRRDGPTSGCAFYAQLNGDKLSSFSCVSGGDTTIQVDTTQAVTLTSSTTSTTTTASSTSATASPTQTAAPAGNGLPSWGTALIVIGSIVGAVALILLIYHFIHNRMAPEDDDSQPLVESKQWRGPWAGRGAE